MIINKILIALLLAVIFNYFWIIKYHKKPLIISIIMLFTDMPSITFNMLIYNLNYSPGHVIEYYSRNIKLYLKGNPIAYFYYSLFFFDLIIGIVNIVKMKYKKAKKMNSSNNYTTIDLNVSETLIKIN